jgi:hypothetical protein
MSDRLPASRPDPIPAELLRVGDSERQQAVGALGEHYAAGRLDQEEFDTRVQAAYGSKTRVDLQGLFADLPEPAPFRPEPPAGWRDGRTARDGGPRRVGPPPFAFVFLVGLVASVLLQFPVLPILLLVWFLAGRHASHRRGPYVPSRT